MPELPPSTKVTPMSSTPHTPVLMDEVLNNLNIQSNGIYIDGTFGRGGYTRSILEHNTTTRVIGIDRDTTAIEYGQKNLKPRYDDRLTLCHTRFSQLDTVSKEHGDKDKVDGVVFDLGVSSPQFDEADRGFSIQHDGPLDMRMDQSNDDLPTAADIINNYDAEEMANIFYTYGEEHHSRIIARKIIERRIERPFSSTVELAAFIKSIYPQKHQKIHPATKSFQGLRIYINQELKELETALEKSLNVLKKNGRLCVVSFHSLEDRIVKQFMRKHSRVHKPVSRHMPIPDKDDETPPLKLVHKKAIQASDKEIEQNPRARSAKLRTAEMQISDYRGVKA